MDVQRLGDKRYRIFIDRGRDPSGRRQRHSEIFHGTKKQADDRERALRTDLVNGTFVESKAGTVGDFLEQWLRSVQSRVEERTYLRYAQMVRTHLAPDLGHVKLKDLGPYQIEEAEQKWAREGNRNTGGPLSRQTVLHLHRCLHTALDRAVKWRLIAVNPVDGVDAPHVAQEEMGYLTPAEAARLVDCLEGTEYELPILVGLFCGLRPTEYLALRWRDLDLERGELRVMQNVHDIRKDRVTEHMGQQVRGFRFGPTKTHRSRRPVSMPEELVQRLRLWRSVQSAHRAQGGRGLGGPGSRLHQPDRAPAQRGDCPRSLLSGAGGGGPSAGTAL